MKQVKEARISDLIPDDLNANKGTEYGQHLVEESVRKFGAGRSILLDKNNRIIAGNKFTENAGYIGLEKVLIIETTGDQIVAVKRTDIDLDTPQGREMAIADNAAAKANISWDTDVIEKLQENWNIDVEAWGIPVSEPEPEPEEPKQELSTRLIVECGSAAKLSALFSELQDRGFQCELKE